MVSGVRFAPGDHPLSGAAGTRGRAINAQSSRTDASRQAPGQRAARIGVGLGQVGPAATPKGPGLGVSWGSAVGQTRRLSGEAGADAFGLGEGRGGEAAVGVGEGWLGRGCDRAGAGEPGAEARAAGPALRGEWVRKRL